jgi:hypothetical protein
MGKAKHPRSERTIFPRDHTRPLKGEHFDRAKEVEKARAKVDKYYMTADEARALPPEVVQRPEVQDRIRYSQRDWPESKSTATRALGPLEPGEGETVQQRGVEAGSIFEGGKVDG